MFASGMEESINNKVKIDDSNVDAVKSMLEFIYTGKATNIDENADYLLKLSDKVYTNSYSLF